MNHKLHLREERGKEKKKKEKEKAVLFNQEGVGGQSCDQW